MQLEVSSDCMAILIEIGKEVLKIERAPQDGLAEIKPVFPLV